MNIDYRTGYLLSADAEALVNTVNCVGVMGKGIALQFKKAFPDNFKNYSIACERKEVRPGEMFVTEQFAGSPRYIINFPTKRHWRARSRLSDVESGLAALADQTRKRDIRSIAMPAASVGLGRDEAEPAASMSSGHDVPRRRRSPAIRCYRVSREHIGRRGALTARERPC